MDTGSFIQDLAVIMAAVGAVSAVCARFGWPKVIGYILAGTAMGKYTFGGSFFINEKSIDVLGQIGIVFLMFTLGLEFSVRKLKKVGNVALPTALLDMAVMIWLGHFVGTKILGWGSVQSLFLGAAISDSATTLLAKTINDMGWGSRRFTKYIFGVTIIEDILCIGVIALLTGIVKTGRVQIGEALFSLGGLLLFMTGVTVFGLLLVPRVINSVARLKDDETLLLTILGFCFLVSFIALRLNYSLALGAFMVGVMGAESEHLRRIYQHCIPLRTMFSAIFFVTIGLLVNPAGMLAQWPAVLGLTLLVIIGKSLNCTIGLLLTGQDLKNAIQTGVGMAQIGEFAYLVALIGVTMKVVDSSLYQIAVGVSILTTLFNPFLMRGSEPFSDWVMRRLPVSWNEYLETYANWYERFRHTQAPSGAAAAVRLNLSIVLLLMALVAVNYIAAGMLAGLDYSGISPVVEAHKRSLLWGAASLMTIPGAIFLFFRARAFGRAVAEVLIPAKVAGTGWALSFRSMTGSLFALAGIAALFFESVMLSGSIMPEQAWARAGIVILLLTVGVAGWKQFRYFGTASLETLRKVVSEEVETAQDESAADLLDIHTEKVKVGADVDFLGCTLCEINLRARAGVSVLCIERGGKTIVNPRADDVLEASDTVLLLGDDEQIAKARELLS
ncbi:MAG: cation:proton antiporter [Kiritimatiellae bacterium]|nr:cation:proton antiporter [Kiritimatiellia bacterium]